MKPDDETEIIDYDPAYRDAFRDLNLEWIEMYFKVEEPDRKALGDPEGYILSRGGRVFFARYEGEVVGTCALLNAGDGVFELVKMAVAPRAQGKQIGKKLCLHAVEEARRMGARQVFLESNTVLTPAIELYRKAGFRQVDLIPSPYRRSNIRMQIDL
ncbi:GNAT family N-acetyltransferase [Larkinella soli]|uniref:GNAT family N-acetyltransferase n=1 Tax=Larkinella soli TaxID=1770527 RepID=UPI000FFB343E|nr:GNAT family N-acetyltransferase [Larkinella soli]